MRFRLGTCWRGWKLPPNPRDHVPARPAGASIAGPGATGYRRSCGRRKRNCSGGGTSRSLGRGRGWGRWFEATSRITRCRRTSGHFRHSVTASWISGDGRYGGAARETRQHGNGSSGSRTTICRGRASFTPDLSNASPSNIRGGSRMRECRSYGSVRGACGKGPRRNNRIKWPLRTQ